MDTNLLIALGAQPILAIAGIGLALLTFRPWRFRPPTPKNL
jgi:hypothetical protein